MLDCNSFDLNVPARIGMRVICVDNSSRPLVVVVVMVVVVQRRSETSNIPNSVDGARNKNDLRNGKQRLCKESVESVRMPSTVSTELSVARGTALRAVDGVCDDVE
jgi:hypothetical protein